MFNFVLKSRYSLGSPSKASGRGTQAVAGLALVTSGTGRSGASSNRTVRRWIVAWAVASYSSAATRSGVESWMSGSLIITVSRS